MDIQLEKYKLMEWLISLKDESIISKLMNIKSEVSTSSDWSDDVSETEKLLVEVLGEIKKGEPSIIFNILDFFIIGLNRRNTAMTHTFIAFQFN